jgi:hypothetical protein
MSEAGDQQPKVTLHLTWTDYAPNKLSARIEEFKQRNRRVELDDRIAAIQFLRGTASRAGFVLPALYLALGARSLPHDAGRSHWQAVQAAALEQSSLHTIALACRSIFDDSKNRLSGKRIARLSDETLASVAQYWAERSKKSQDEAVKALVLLRRLFDRCARPAKLLLDQPSLLERRIGLLKYYAHRQAAHISLEDYLFDVLDLIHVAAAIVLVGAIIVDFDDPWRAERYFDSIDEGGWQAAKEVFPHLEIERIFKNWNIHQQAALKWRVPYTDGVEYMLNQLPSAIGYWDSRPDSAQ